jgi:hypothetical protein
VKVRSRTEIIPPSIHTEDSERRYRAKKILENGGAMDISYTGEASVPNSGVSIS